MKKNILDFDKNLQDYRLSLGNLLLKVSQFVVRIANPENPKLIGIVSELKQNIDRPFMFVVVGEVNAGKSSFINALLGTEVCETNIKPWTDSIQLITYSNEPFKRKTNSHLTEIGKPIEILKEISIVDTPGTNSIIEEHQIITEKFIPNSDLAFFVLFARNPYYATTWQFLDYVSAQWYTKVVFILQQADLLKSSDLEINISEVKKIAEQKGIRSPLVFTTSAEREINGQIEDSGFDKIRTYIKDIVATKETYKTKLCNISKRVGKVINDLGQDIQKLENRLNADKEAVTHIKRRFERGREQSENEVALTVKQLSERYVSIIEPIKKEFQENLSVTFVIGRTISFKLKKWFKNFAERCTQKLKSEIEELANARTAHILDGIRQFGIDLRQDLDRIQTNGIKSERIFVKVEVLEQRQKLLENIKQKVEKLLSDEGLVQAINTGVEGAAFGVGGAFAAVAVVIAQIIELVLANFALAALETAFFGVGVLIFFVGFAWRRNRIIKNFEQALDNGKGKFESDVAERLKQKLSIIYEDLERECLQFYNDVEQEEREILPLIEEYSSIKADAEQLLREIPTLLN
jgi:GTP-binding protein EngB required for normal cell division